MRRFVLMTATLTKPSGAPSSTDHSSGGVETRKQIAVCSVSREKPRSLEAMESAKQRVICSRPLKNSRALAVKMERERQRLTEAWNEYVPLDSLISGHTELESR